MMSHPLRIMRAALPLVFALVLAQPVTAEPVITEFLAANTKINADNDGVFSDWIEIFNPGTNSVDLDGYFLTDNPSDLQKWQFPEVKLDPQCFVIVFASEKNRSKLNNPLHTNFRLKSNGGYLALVLADGATVSSTLGPNYPSLAPGVSYGRPPRTGATWT